jgi:hypothetical protein
VNVNSKDLTLRGPDAEGRLLCQIIPRDRREGMNAERPSPKKHPATDVATRVLFSIVDNHICKTAGVLLFYSDHDGHGVVSCIVISHSEHTAILNDHALKTVDDKRTVAVYRIGEHTAGIKGAG